MDPTGYVVSVYFLPFKAKLYGSYRVRYLVPVPTYVVNVSKPVTGAYFRQWPDRERFDADPLDWTETLSFSRNNN